MLLVRLVGMMSHVILVMVSIYCMVGLSLMLVGIGVDVKRCIAYSTIVQMLFSLVLLLSLVYSMVQLYLVLHALYKSFGLWFWMVSTLLPRTGY
jgi:NADH:ubiquinone oxidoreductase subunit 5 (subunit L)/multisubunit Na+/H+ antiporter MnhA subunit